MELICLLDSEETETSRRKVTLASVYFGLLPLALWQADSRPHLPNYKLLKPIFRPSPVHRCRGVELGRRKPYWQAVLSTFLQSREACGEFGRHRDACPAQLVLISSPEYNSLWVGMAKWSSRKETDINSTHSTFYYVKCFFLNLFHSINSADRCSLTC